MTVDRKETEITTDRGLYIEKGSKKSHSRLWLAHIVMRIKLVLKTMPDRELGSLNQFQKRLEMTSGSKDSIINEKSELPSKFQLNCKRTSVL